MEPILSLCNVGYAYHDHEPVLHNVGLSLAHGERVVLLGNNGAGKSTLFLCCNGVLTPSCGTVALGGRVISRSTADIQLLRRNVGLVFQEPDDQMIAPTVESEVSFGPMNLRLPPETVQKNTAKALADMKLTEYRTRAPHSLSGGEKKRVSIADILAMEPQVVLLDEPTASLDMAHTALLERILAELHTRGLALLVSTHDVEFAWRWAERAIVLSHGQVIADAPVAQVFADGEVLQKAGLTKPILFETARTLFPQMPIEMLPRSVAQLKEMLEVSRG